MRRSRNTVLGAALLALLLLLGACGSGGDEEEAGGSDAGGGEEQVTSVTVGSDAFGEAQILGEMYAQVLENAGFEVERQLSIQNREIRLGAMENGEVDIAPEYVASLYSVLDPTADLSGDAQELAAAMEPLLAEKNLALLEPSEAIDTNAFVVTQATASKHNLSQMSDLADVAGELTLGAPAECPKRPFCIPGLKDTYGIEFGDFRALEYGAATAQALKAGAVDVALLFSTDALIEENGFVLLEDDQGLQSADNIVPLVTADVADAVADLLNEVSAALTTAEMTQMNARVSIEQEDPADVAQAYLEDKGLL